MVDHLWRVRRLVPISRLERSGVPGEFCTSLNDRRCWHERNLLWHEGLPAPRFRPTQNDMTRCCQGWAMPPTLMPTSHLTISILWRSQNYFRVVDYSPSIDHAEWEGSLQHSMLGYPYRCSDAMYFVRLRMRSCTEPSLVVPMVAKSEPQTGMSLEPWLGVA